ncbi:MAG: class I SAM-dependent methyltransferase [Hyphomicrobiaceae bacterium]
MNAPLNIAPTPDFTAIKARQNAAWRSGDYARIGSTLQITGEELAETMNVRPGARVLDVAAGNGNATLAFARRWCEVTSTDYVDTLLARGKARADAEGHDIRFQIADAEDLPFIDGTFDAVVSTFGVMFAPNQKRAASELTRVCRSGGRIGLANWTPESFIGALFKVLGRHVPPPAGVSSPALWGARPWIDDTFGGVASAIDFNTKQFRFRYASPDHFVEIFQAYYGPVHKAFAALEHDAQHALRQDILDLIAHHNTAMDGTMNVPAEYAQIVITRS